MVTSILTGEVMSTIPIDQKASALSTVLTRNQEDIVSEWLSEMTGATRRGDLMKDSELRSQCTQFLRLTKQALDTAGTNFQAPAWDKVREMLADISRSRAQQGFTPTETATFVFSAKRPFFTQLRQVAKDADSLANEIWIANELLDTLGLYTTEVYQK